ncbi:hypothetical protein ACIRP5_11630 [Streptomyces sp. NPDC101221]|uniref:hypothetical protein n=1 Tax=Streptomyces sp. NPDC101221 TaxID=3366132 RepID=UPI0037FAA45E
MTAISLLAVKVDSTPQQIELDPENGLRLRLEVGVHLDLTDTSEETCRVLARHLMTAARIKAAQRLPEVA